MRLKNKEVLAVERLVGLDCLLGYWRATAWLKARASDAVNLRK